MCDPSLVDEPLSSGQWENVPKAKKDETPCCIVSKY